METTPMFVNNWARVAQPQSDGYDLHVLSEMDELRWGWVKSQPVTELTMCDGHVGLRTTGLNVFNNTDFRPARPDEITEPAWDQTEYLNKWADGYAALTGFLDEFWPHVWLAGSGKGCCSGHHTATQQQPWHAAYVTMNDRIGCAQGIYHELGHIRLETLGIGIDTHDGALLLNAPDELYTSSVRHDCKRPMSAVLHGVYAWLMFGENDYWLYKAGLLPVDDLQNYVAPNLPKIRKGIEEIQRYGRFTPDGDAFICGVYAWSTDLLDRWNEYIK